MITQEEALVGGKHNAFDFCCGIIAKAVELKVRILTHMKHDDKLREHIKDLTLMLLYLNSFDDEYCQRSWKGYNSGDLNKLAEEGLISEGRRAKPVVLYDEGIEKAKALCIEYGIQLSKEVDVGDA